MDFTNKTIWITGASSGIGAELAVQLSGFAKRLILSGRDEEKLKVVRQRCQTPCEQVVFAFDLEGLTPSSGDFEVLWEEIDGVDILINSGGISQRSKAMDCIEEVDRRLMEVNYFGTVSLTKWVVNKWLQQPPALLERRPRGEVVTLASVSGKIGAPMRSGYCASKHAIIGYMDCLRPELAGAGINIHVVSPGWVRTAIAENALAGDARCYNRKDRDTEGGIAVEKFVVQMIGQLKKGRKDIVIAEGRARLGYHLRRLFPETFHTLLNRIYRHQDDEH
ncbi:short-subunit dehydrogenase [Sinobacterium caligoides]|uniref:Short-subunit dehydrogenase n=1 Tax=Sinobacterium caligoides TaxID=933926 RepID=A0A3N2DZT1_9GAMM|nr:SDR family NAD(P)-dependent oxidoreductase [Sinobacterium caligoides]ROS05277.1 short-subunit dehydrogenase [Sinobacterium caligoides]